MARRPHPNAVDFEGVFRVHSPALLRLIRSRIDDPASADDILQETFVRFYRFYVVPGRLDPSRPVGPLLATIARRETARRGRVLGRQRRLDIATWPGAVPDMVGSDDHVAALDEGPIVRTALRGLDPRQRRLLLQWECRRSTESLATTEQVSAAVLKQVVVRARRNFRERYRAACGQADGLFSAAAPPFIGLALRLRSRLRVGPIRGDAFAAGLGLAACSMALVAANGAGGPGHSGAVALVSNQAVAVPEPAGPDNAGVATGRLAATRPMIGSPPFRWEHPRLHRRPVGPSFTPARTSTSARVVLVARHA